MNVRVVVYFRNDDQILLVERDSSGWFSLSVVPISYVVGVDCSSEEPSGYVTIQPTPDRYSRPFYSV